MWLGQCRRMNEMEPSKRTFNDCIGGTRKRAELETDTE